MRNTIFLLIVLITIGFYQIGCQKEDSGPVFATTWPLVEEGQYMLTTNQSAVACAIAPDVALDTGAYNFRIRGQITYIDSTLGTITEYGHCWSEEEIPTLENSVGTDARGTITEPGAFVSNAQNLKMLTHYYARSYVVIDDTILAYNPAVVKISTITDENLWISRTSFGGNAIRNSVSFTIDSVGYVGTGNVGNNLTGAFWSYDPVNRAWQQRSSFTQNGQREGAVAFVVGKRAFCGLGKDINGDLSDFWVYDSDKNTWNKLTWKIGGNSNEIFPGGARSNAVAFTIDGLGYVGSGSINGVPDGDFFSFDVGDWQGDRNPWGAVESLPFGREREGAVVFVIGTRAYLGTGVDKDGNYLNDFWEFNKASGSMGAWATITPLPGVSRTGAIAFAINKDYLGISEGFVGMGFDGTNVLDDFYVYIPEMNSWEKRMDYLAGGMQDAVAFVSAYQRVNEPFVTQKGFVVGGHDGSILRKDLYEYLP